jgi:hypothetical protein
MLFKVYTDVKLSNAHTLGPSCFCVCSSGITNALWLHAFKTRRAPGGPSLKKQQLHLQVTDTTAGLSLTCSLLAQKAAAAPARL